MLTPYSYRLFFEFAKIVKYHFAKYNLFVLYRRSDFSFEEFAQLVLPFGGGEFRAESVPGRPKEKIRLYAIISLTYSKCQVIKTLLKYQKQ